VSKNLSNLKQYGKGKYKIFPHESAQLALKIMAFQLSERVVGLSKVAISFPSTHQAIIQRSEMNAGSYKCKTKKSSKTRYF
jgi:hypothetical protein